MKLLNRIFLITTALLALNFLVISYFQPIRFVTEDLGRHISNGAWIINALNHHLDLHTHSPLYSNFYSYTEPRFAVDNHHWLFGVFIFFVHKFFGFTGISIASFLLISLSLVFIYLTARSLSNSTTAWFVLMLVLPPMLWRVGPRPELFSYLFFSLEFYLLTLYSLNKIKLKPVLIILSVMMMLWVNIHIFFIFGLFLLVLFYLNSIKRSDLDKTTNRISNITIKNNFFILIGASLAALFINPFGINAIIEPFLIFKSYGYTVFENQPIFFVQKRNPGNPIYILTELATIITILSFIIKIGNFKNLKNLLLKKHREYSMDLLNLILFTAITILAFKINRVLTLAGFCMVPILAYNLYLKRTSYANFFAKFKIPLSVIYAVPIIALLTYFNIFFCMVLKRNITSKFIALPDNINRSANFIKKFNIPGPMFNNYDIGGYVIYHLFPKWRCFVDNRPEAYSYNFFKKVYEPMQANEDVWHAIDARYKFNIIYFYRLDMTRDAQPFLVKRLKDPEWVPVFVDNWTLILVRNTEINRAIIEKFALPKKMFKAKYS